MTALTLADVKEHLNITTGAYDPELLSTLAAAEAAIGKRVGPLTPTTVTARIVGHRGSGLALPITPVISLTSVTPFNGVAYTLSDLWLDTRTGIISYAYGDGQSSAALFNVSSYDVVYLAGWAAPLPDDLRYAVLELVRHLWKSQRGGSARPGSTTDAPQVPGYLMPYAVEALLEPYTEPGFA